MKPLTMLWTEVGILVVDTGSVWWRLLPQILSIYLLGWLGSELALKLAVIAGDLSAWLALAVFSFAFLSQLIAIVLILRLAGRELGIREMIPDEERVADDRESSITHLLAVTLLPFLGIYAAFGEVQRAASGLAVEQFARYGAFGSQESILGVLNEAATQHKLRLVAIVLGVYVLRRVVDQLQERTGWRPLGILLALLETFFILVLVMGGIRLWQQVQIWLEDRAFMGWLAAVKEGLASIFAVFQINLPAILVQATDFFWNHMWPVFWEVLSQPIIWLAVAALIFGSQVLSIADLWRKGQPLSQRVPGVSKFAKRSDRLAARRIGPPPAGVRKAAHEFREAFLGDIDDKYLPTVHSLRLVIRAGAIFLGALVLVYAMQDIGRNYLSRFINLIVGGHEVDFWLVISPYVDLLVNVAFEPLRICLLAVAFRRCLELFRAQAMPNLSAGPFAVSGTPAPGQPLPGRTRP